MATEMKKSAPKVSTPKEQEPLKQEVPVETIAVESVVDKELDIIKKENEELKNMLKDLYGKLDKMNTPESKAETVLVTSKMDKPCTLVHLIDCTPGLSTTIRVNGVNFSFNRFGERRLFRFADMQNITSNYASWFSRGVFTLGEDCDEFANDFGVDIMSIPMDVEKYKKIAVLPLAEFNNIVESLNGSQATLLAKVWIQRHESGEAGYDNFEKIKALNAKTKGFMKEFMTKIVSVE